MAEQEATATDTTATDTTTGQDADVSTVLTPSGTGGETTTDKAAADAAAKSTDEGAGTKGKETADATDKGKTGDDNAAGDALFSADAVQLPEGVELDSELMDVFKPIAEAHGLTQEAGEALINAHLQGLQAMAQAVQEELTQQTQERADGWLKAVREDGELMKPENQKLAASFLTRMGASDELKKALNETGMGNHPDLVRIFYKAALAIKEDNPLGDTSNPNNGPKSIEDRLYGDTKSQ